MPNHVATILHVSGPEADVEKFVESIREDEDTYDFDKLLPVPDEIAGTVSPTRCVSEEEYIEAVAAKNQAELDFAAGKIDEFTLKMAQQMPMTEARAAELRKKYGATDWYDWRLNNYGTKWGMYEVEYRGTCSGKVSSAEFYYMTAWSPATEYFLAVSQKFPTLTFYHEYADEGGWFVGAESIQDGEIIDTFEGDWNSGEGLDIRIRVGYGPWDEDEEEEEDAEA